MSIDVQVIQIGKGNYVGDMVFHPGGLVTYIDESLERLLYHMGARITWELNYKDFNP